MEAHAVLGSDPIPVPLCFAELCTCIFERCIGHACIHRSLDREMCLCDRLSRDALNLKGIVMDGLDAGDEGLLALIMTLQTCFLRVLQRTRHPVRCVLLASVTHIGHVAVHAGNTGVGMNARRPRLEFRMLRLEHHRLGVGVHPVALESARLPGLIELVLGLGIEAVVVRVVHTSVLSSEVVLRMALRTDIGAHIIMWCGIHIDTTACHCLDEALLIDAQLHRIGIVACRAAEPLIVGDGSRNFIKRLRCIRPSTFFEVHIINIRTLAL